MPTAALRFCLHPGCQQLVRRGRCAAHRRASGGHLYSLAQWRHPVWGLRAQVLREEFFCRGCGRALTARDAEVDHIRPHEGDRRLFLDRQNVQGLCKACHTKKTRAEGRR